MLTFVPMLLTPMLLTSTPIPSDVVISVRVFRLKKADDASAFFEKSEGISDAAGGTSSDTEKKVEARVAELTRVHPNALICHPILRTLENRSALI